MNSTVKQTMTPEQLVSLFGQSLEFDRPLADLSSFGTGGPARLFILARSADEVSKAVRSAKKIGIPYFLLGGGTNLLISDSGFNGLVVKVVSSGVRLCNGTEIECGAGEDLMTLVNFATKHSLTGLEFAAGIPGSVGGAVAGNAGAYGNEIGSVLTEVSLVDRDGVARKVTPEYCSFEYRNSRLKETGEIVTDICLHLTLGDRTEISDKVDEILAVRKEKHPVALPSAGSFFKNIPDPAEPHGKLPAGRLLDEAGARKMSVGGAQVYEKHANIIVNTGNATSKEIVELADKMKAAVSEQFGIELVEEVVKLGEF